MKMSLNYIVEKIKGSSREVYITILVILIGLLGFGLGRLSKLEDRKVPITISNLEVSEKVDSLSPFSVASAAVAGQYVASKTGTAFYLPWCAGVKRIKESNKVWFNNKDDAVAAGYSPASNCKGL